MWCTSLRLCIIVLSTYLDLLYAGPPSQHSIWASSIATLWASPALLWLIPDLRTGGSYRRKKLLRFCVLKVQLWAKTLVLLPPEAIVRLSKYMYPDDSLVKSEGLSLSVEEGWGPSRQKEQPSKAQTPVSTLPWGPWVPLLDQSLVVDTRVLEFKVFLEGSQCRRLLCHVFIHLLPSWTWTFFIKL